MTETCHKCQTTLVPAPIEQQRATGVTLSTLWVDTDGRERCTDGGFHWPARTTADAL